MPLIKQSFAWWCVQKNVNDPEAFLKAAKGVGFEGVELLPRELWQLAQNNGLTIVSEGAGSLTEGLNRRENHETIRAEVIQKLDLATHYNIPNLIVFSGNRNGLDDNLGAENTVEGLRLLAPLAEASGVTLVLELLNSKVDHVDYMCDHTEWAIDVVSRVNSPMVRVLYDVYHMQIMEGDIIRTVRKHGRHFGHIHIAGNPGRRDLDSEQELNYPPIIRALRDSGYDGFVGHEFIPKHDPLESLQRAFQVCNL